MKCLENISYIFNDLIPDTPPPENPIAIFICGITSDTKRNIILKRVMEEFKIESYIPINNYNIKNDECYIQNKRLLRTTFEPMAYKSGHNIIYENICKHSYDLLKTFRELKSLNYHIVVILEYSNKKILTDDGFNKKYLEKIYKILKTEFKNILGNFKDIDDLRLYQITTDAEPKILLRKNGNITQCEKGTFYFNFQKYCK